jgi:flagellin-like protein
VKANRKFVTEEEAVSPVIAVILMVAITVVLAATVFVLVSDIGGQQGAAPAINFQSNEALDRLVVNSADSRADWARLQVSANGTTALMGAADCNTSTTDNCANDDGTAGPNIGTAARAVSAYPDQIGAGDFLGFCDNTANAQVTVTVVDIQANSKVGDYVFSDLRACAP